MKCGAATLPASGIARDSVHPGLVSIPGSQSVLETPGPLLLLAGQPGGRVLSPKLGRDRRFISLRSELAGDPAQDFTYRHPRLSFDWLRHVLEHGAADVRKPGEAFLESGEVYRERGH